MLAFNSYSNYHYLFPVICDTIQYTGFQILYFSINILIYETSNRNSVFVHVLKYNAFLFLNSNGGLIRVHVITLHVTYTQPTINDPYF